MLWKTTELDKLTKIQMAILGWKRYVTFEYLDAKKNR